MEFYQNSRHKKDGYGERICPEFPHKKILVALHYVRVYPSMRIGYKDILCIVIVCMRFRIAGLVLSSECMAGQCQTCVTLFAVRLCVCIFRPEMSLLVLAPSYAVWYQKKAAYFTCLSCRHENL